MPRKELIQTVRAFELRYEQNLSWPVIAERLGYSSPTSVKNCVRKYRARIRREILLKTYGKPVENCRFLLTTEIKTAFS